METQKYRHMISVVVPVHNGVFGSNDRKFTESKLCKVGIDSC